MYFNKDKLDTNIDKKIEDENKTKFSLFSFFKKYRLFLFLGVFLIIGIIVFCIIFNNSNKDKEFLSLLGDEEVIVYLGSDYVEPGFYAYNSYDEDLTSMVKVESSLNINAVGQYEVVYKLGDVVKTRQVKIIEKPKEHTYIYLNGVNNNVNVYLNVGDEYVEPGYKVFSSYSSDLTDKVVVTGEVDTSRKGVYKLVYSVENSDNVTVTDSRMVIVMDMNLKLSVDNPSYTKDSALIKVVADEEYFSYFVLPNNDMVTSKEYTYKVTENGNYTFTYYNKLGMSKKTSIEVTNIDRENPTGSCSVVVDRNVSTINISASDNGNISKYVYNGKDYTTDTIRINSKLSNAQVTIYDEAGNYKNVNCDVQEVFYDDTPPSGSCIIDHKTNGSVITISASDDSGIAKYVYNNKVYNSSVINLSSTINSAKVHIYDVFDNLKEITCSVNQKVYIENIKKDGVIVTLKANSSAGNIAGYYFSYDSTRPNKKNGAYVATNNKSIDVVRLPGKTYVWVEDSKGNISVAKTISISNDALLNTSSGYTMLKNKSLSKFLDEKGSSIDEFNKLISRSVRAAGLYTKKAAATAGVALQTVLAQKYQIILPYWWGGKSWSFGAKSSWGSYSYVKNENSGTEYLYDGLDCTGFTTWAYVNAGYDIASVTNKYGVYFDDWWKNRSDFSSGEVGDFLVYNTNRNNRHAKLIIGKTSDAYITAEAKGGNYGMIVSKHLFSEPGKYKVEKGELLMSYYDKISSSKIPTGY